MRIPIKIILTLVATAIWAGSLKPASDQSGPKPSGGMGIDYIAGLLIRMAERPGTITMVEPSNPALQAFSALDISLIPTSKKADKDHLIQEWERVFRAIFSDFLRTLVYIGDMGKFCELLPKLKIELDDLLKRLETFRSTVALDKDKVEKLKKDIWDLRKAMDEAQKSLDLTKEMLGYLKIDAEKKKVEIDETTDKIAEITQKSKVTNADANSFGLALVDFVKQKAELDTQWNLYEADQTDAQCAKVREAWTKYAIAKTTLEQEADKNKVAKLPYDDALEGAVKRDLETLKAC